MECWSLSILFLIIVKANFQSDILVIELVTCLGSFAFTSLWIYFLGSPMVDKTVPIPYVQLVISLASFTIPILIGIGIKYKWPKFAGKIQRISRPFFFVCLIVFPVVGSLQNLHFFYLCTWRTIVSGALLGILGYIFGALLAFVAKQGRPQV